MSDTPVPEPPDIIEFDLEDTVPVQNFRPRSARMHIANEGLTWDK